MLNPRGNVGFNGCEQIAVTYSNSQRSTPAHRIPTQVDTIGIDFVVFDRPFDGIDDSLFHGSQIATGVHFDQPFVLGMHPTPPPVASLVFAAVEVQREMIVG